MKLSRPFGATKIGIFHLPNLRLCLSLPSAGRRLIPSFDRQSLLFFARSSIARISDHNLLSEGVPKVDPNQRVKAIITMKMLVGCLIVSCTCADHLPIQSFNEIWQEVNSNPNP